MRSSVLRYLVIAWTILWFAVIVPGHQRGAILLPGSAGAGSSPTDQSPQVRLPSCCATQETKGKNPVPAPLRSGCAVCDQVAKTTPPIEYNFKPLFMAFLEIAPPAKVFTLSDVQFLPTPEARGPPAGA